MRPAPIRSAVLIKSPRPVFSPLRQVETVGPVYMAVAGVPTFRADHCAALATLALEMLGKLGDYADDNGLPLQALMGIHCGPVIGGIIGAHMPR